MKLRLPQCHADSVREPTKDRSPYKSAGKYNTEEEENQPLETDPGAPISIQVVGLADTMVKCSRCSMTEKIWTK